MNRAYLALTFFLLAACKPGVISGGGDVWGWDPKTGKVLTCDPAKFKGITQDQLSADYAKHVGPLFTSTSSGCTSCHSASSGRQFIVTGDAASDFYKQWSAGLLASGPGTVLDRVQASDPATRMPKGMDAWDVEKVGPVSQLACELQGYTTSGGALVDEQFPPDLLQPYSGAPANYYDNTFLGFFQLKGKVAAQFNDNWVRNNVDNFAANIGALGGVDFNTHFIEARTATSDFLLAMDQLSKDVCSQAATNKTGPFAGIDTSANIVDQLPSTTATFEAEAASTTKSPATGAGQSTSNPAGYSFYTNGSFAVTYNFPSAGSYTVNMSAKGSTAADPNADGSAGAVHGAFVDLKIDGITVHTFEVSNASYQGFSYTTSVATGGNHSVSLAFTNDYPTAAGSGDRNFTLDYFNVAGPNGSSTGTTRADAAKANIKTLYQRLLYRSPSAQEVTDSLALITDLTDYHPLPDPWSGLCEGLLKSPDYLFTLPPSRASSADATTRAQLLMVKVAQDLAARPPTPTELAKASTMSSDQMVDYFLATPDFKNYFFFKMRVRTESDGSPSADEPARLWTYLMLNGQPFEQLLSGDYSVDASFNKVARDAVHGQTGVLTMAGYIQHKQGLPHYNYAARVLEDFMGYVFEVPPEVVAMRLGATASTTVDPKSICFNCHQLLTPLATQRSSWDDDGNFLAADPSTGKPIDDSDRDLVPSYEYKGKGLQAFSTQAIKKERFIRQTLNAEYLLLFGRPMRYDTDERGIYKQLWDLNQSSHGDLRQSLKAMMRTQQYQGL